MILISSLNSVSVCLLLWVFSTCLFTLDRIGPVYFRCVCFSCCYFLRLHETFDAPIIGLTCVCVFFFFSILFLTCCDIQCDSTVRARGLRLLLHNKMLQLTCPTLFPPQIDKHTHNLRSGRELSQFSCRAENCYPQMLNESWAGFRGGNSPKFFWVFFFFVVCLFSCFVAMTLQFLIILCERYFFRKITTGRLVKILLSSFFYFHNLVCLPFINENLRKFIDFNFSSYIYPDLWLHV